MSDCCERQARDQTEGHALKRVTRSLNPHLSSADDGIRDASLLGAKLGKRGMSQQCVQATAHKELCRQEIRF